ncbi:hypothetical protein JZ785_03695 [Alicyclobacillus curvatus]|nr:hypothetical protein JZ785_03695 [Alicyclobacillus curvatus]
MCELARKLLAEKLVDDFYENGVVDGAVARANTIDLAEQLKALLSKDHHAFLYRWEAQCAETSGSEIRRFADFVASLLMECHVGGEVEEKPISSRATED